MALNNFLQSLKQWAFILPTITVTSWLAMLATLFGSWYMSGEPRYISEEDTQKIAFISDIGAQNLKPVFIACTALAMSTHIPTIMLYFYYLRPTRQVILPPPCTDGSTWRSPPQSTCTRVGIPLLSTGFSLVGASSLILLTIFDTARYASAHRCLLPTSIIAHIIGCTLLCGWSSLRVRQHRQYYYSMAAHHRDKFTIELHAPAPSLPLSMASLVVKCVLVAFEFGLVVLFAVMTWQLKTFDTAAVMEWVVVLMFAAYMVCQVVDMWILGTRGTDSSVLDEKREKEEEEENAIGIVSI